MRCVSDYVELNETILKALAEQQGGISDLAYAFHNLICEADELFIGYEEKVNKDKITEIITLTRLVIDQINQIEDVKD